MDDSDEFGPGSDDEHKSMSQDQELDDACDACFTNSLEDAVMDAALVWTTTKPACRWVLPVSPVSFSCLLSCLPSVLHSPSYTKRKETIYLFLAIRRSQNKASPFTPSHVSKIPGKGYNGTGEDGKGRTAPPQVVQIYQQLLTGA